jgi:hypothetical protein
MGVCLTGYFEILLSLTPHTIAIGVNPWNHIMTVEFNKDYPLMRTLRESDARHNGCPAGSAVWVPFQGSLERCADHFNDVYWFDGEDFCNVELWKGEEGEVVGLSPQTIALHAAIHAARNTPGVRGTRLVLTEV